MSHSCAKRVLYSTMITNHMTNSLIGPILIRNSHVSAKFKLRSTGLSSEISLLRIRRETVTGLTLLMVTPYPHRAPITPFVEPIAPFWIVMMCMTHRDVAGLLRPAIRYRPATGL